MSEDRLRQSKSDGWIQGGIAVEIRPYGKETFLVCTFIASFLLWAIYQLLTQAKLGLPAECFFMAQVLVVLAASPYLAAYAICLEAQGVSFMQLLTLSPVSSGRYLLMRLVMSQIPILCWVFLSTGFAFFVTEIPPTKALQMLTVLGLYSLSAGAVGMWGAQVFQDALFGAECAYLLWCVLIGSSFLLVPLERYMHNIQPIIPPVLHLNPLIVVCNIFEGMDIFRTALLYELIPIASYRYEYPSWYLVGFWQLLIGGCCFLGTWRIAQSYKHVL